LREKQANSSYCFVCGLKNPYGLHLKFYRTGTDEVTTEYTVPKHFEGYPGVVHGGIVAAMLDEVVGRAAMGADRDNPRFRFTARLTVRYRKNVPVGVPLRVVGRLDEDKQGRATSTGAIYDPAGILLAEADGLLVDVPAEILDSAGLEGLGWRVYPEDDQP
jgi:acyl-coenzyme A thioesterase PaaI-like protein